MFGSNNAQADVDDGDRSTAAMPVPTKENDWLGFCPSAVKLQNGDKRVRLLQGHFLICRSSVLMFFFNTGLSQETYRLRCSIRRFWRHNILLLGEGLCVSRTRQHRLRMEGDDEGRKAGS